MTHAEAKERCKGLDAMLVEMWTKQELKEVIQNSQSKKS